MNPVLGSQAQGVGHPSLNENIRTSYFGIFNADDKLIETDLTGYVQLQDLSIAASSIRFLTSED